MSFQFERWKKCREIGYFVTFTDSHGSATGKQVIFRKWFETMPAFKRRIGKMAIFNGGGWHWSTEYEKQQGPR